MMIGTKTTYITINVGTMVVRGTMVVVMGITNILAMMVVNMVIM